jgi:hypothetical protein
MPPSKTIASPFGKYCPQCGYFVPWMKSQLVGECRECPPTPIPVHGAWFPVVGEEDWCFKHTDAPKQRKSIEGHKE